MVDIKANPLFLRDKDLRDGIELMFFAYRDFIAEADKILDNYSYGRAHHRVLYFVGRKPGLTVSELLDILSITKQSLSRVLTQLINDDMIIRTSGDSDKRQRVLKLAPKGTALETQLTDAQSKLISRAFGNAGAAAVEGFRQVLMGLLNGESLETYKNLTFQPK